MGGQRGGEVEEVKRKKRRRKEERRKEVTRKQKAQYGRMDRVKEGREKKRERSWAV